MDPKHPTGQPTPRFTVNQEGSHYVLYVGGYWTQCMKVFSFTEISCKDCTFYLLRELSSRHFNFCLHRDLSFKFLKEVDICPTLTPTPI